MILLNSRTEVYAPLFRSKTTDSSETTFGIELEYNVNESKKTLTHIELLEEYSDLWFWKSEPSISTALYEGLEIVSHPFSLNWIRKNIYELMLLDDFLRSTTHHSPYYAGMHIHIDRRAFKNQRHVHRFIQHFINHQDVYKKISGREQHPIAFEMFSRFEIPSKVLKSYAVSIKNPKTIEVRFFHTTSDINIMMNRIVLLAQIIQLTQKTNEPSNYRIDVPTEIFI